MRILAIDIGSANIKTVILESKFKRFDIVFHDISPVSDALTDFSPGEFILSSGQMEALAEVQQKYAHSIDHIVTNLPFSLFSSRLMSFPFRDKKKIHSAVSFAIEDEIPFNLDECIVTSHLFPSQNKESHVLTGFAPLEPLQKFIGALDSIPLHAAALTMDQAALASLLAKQKNPPGHAIAFLNLGHRKCSFFCFHDGIPVLQRTTMVGGFHVTKAISEKYEIGMAEAELAKIDRAFLPHPGLEMNDDQRIFSKLIESALDPLFMDVQQSLMAFSSRFNTDLQGIYIIGGSALLPGLPQYLSDRWGRQVLPYQLTQHFPNLSIHPQKNSELMLPIAGALSISQLSGETKTQINFRSGTLRADSKGLNLNLKQFLYPAKLALTIYFFALCSLTGQMFALKAALAKKDAQLELSIQGVLGRVSSSFLASLKASPSKLKQSVEKKLEELGAQSVNGGESSFSSLDLILSMSKNVPKSATMEIKQMELTPSSLTMNLESPGESQANAAITALSHQPFLLNPKADPLQPAKGSRKKFAFHAGINFRKEAE